MNQHAKPILFENNALKLIDQRRLPLEEVYIDVTSLQEGHDAIRDMIVRGAPCIGFCAIYTIALTLKNYSEFREDIFLKDCDYLNQARPTAVNLKFEIDKCKDKVINLAKENQNPNFLYEKIKELGDHELNKSHEKNLMMAKYAEEELARISEGPYQLQTHCNTGFLACGSLGTALGVISYLNTQKKVKHVWVDETRPYLQGSRLSSYELLKENISHDIVVDGACSYLMREGRVDAIFVGADRIALNGDTANKIGTSTLAITAKYYNIPFYVVAPLSSFDPHIESGKEIEIELREQKEITQIKGEQISHPHARALNPSFDVTEAHLITGIICEKGVLRYPYKDQIKKAYEN